MNNKKKGHQGTGMRSYEKFERAFVSTRPHLRVRFFQVLGDAKRMSIEDIPPEDRKYVVAPGYRFSPCTKEREVEVSRLVEHLFSTLDSQTLLRFGYHHCHAEYEANAGQDFKTLCVVVRWWIEKYVRIEVAQRLNLNELTVQWALDDVRPEKFWENES